MSYNVLIVDDSAVVRSVIRKTLDLAKVDCAQVWEASNGSEGLQVLEREWVDLIFLDLNMPVMGGVEMIKNIHANGVTGSTPVIVVSTEGSEKRIGELEELGVRGFLRKPFRPEEFRDIVDRTLGVTND